MQWYYVADSQRHGPVAPVEFERLVADQTIKPNTLVWREGMAQWQPYSAVAAAAGTGSVSAGSDETQVCVVSGKAYPVREMIQYEGKWISAEHRDEYFQRLREGVAQPGVSVVPGPFGYGGFWRRFGAAFVDGIILWIVNQVMAIVLFAIVGMDYSIGGPRFHTGQSGDPWRMLAIVGLFQIAAIVIAIAYDIVFLRKFDATPGKMALGIKLLRTDGSKLSVGRIVGRYFAKILSGIILFIGYIMAGFDDEKRALHDRICDTRVVKTRA